MPNSRRDPWPFPGDGPLARARRIAHAYRKGLHDADPERCAEVDNQMTRWGQNWVVPGAAIHQLDDYIGAADAADLGEVGLATVRQWRLRGRLAGHLDEHGRWHYQVRDVLKVAAETRRRQPRPPLTEGERRQ